MQGTTPPGGFAGRIGTDFPVRRPARCEPARACRWWCRSRRTSSAARALDGGLCASRLAVVPRGTSAPSRPSARSPPASSSSSSSSTTARCARAWGLLRFSGDDLGLLLFFRSSSCRVSWSADLLLLCGRRLVHCGRHFFREANARPRRDGLSLRLLLRSVQRQQPPARHRRVSGAAPPRPRSHRSTPRRLRPGVLPSPAHQPRPDAASSPWRESRVERRGGQYLAHRRLRLDVDPPARELGGQAGVLALFADSQRELPVRHDDGRGVVFLADASRCSTWAGLRALATNRAGSGSHWMTSMRSPFSSLTMFWMRMPRRPTHEPTGSMPSCRAQTATLLRKPASRAIDLISTTPRKISGTSSSNRRLQQVLVRAREDQLRAPDRAVHLEQVELHSLARRGSARSAPARLPGRSPRSCRGRRRCASPPCAGSRRRRCRLRGSRTPRTPSRARPRAGAAARLASPSARRSGPRAPGAPLRAAGRPSMTSGLRLRASGSADLDLVVRDFLDDRALEVDVVVTGLAIDLDRDVAVDRRCLSYMRIRGRPPSPGAPPLWANSSLPPTV